MFRAHKTIVSWGFVLLAALGFAALAQPAMAAVSGYNYYLQEEAEGKAYIPMKPATSGVLGDLTPGGVVGASADMLTLSGKGSSSMGSLSYDLFFDLGNNIGPTGEPILYAADEIDTSTMDLFLDLVDLDFVPVTGAGRVYLEMLTLTFIRNEVYDGYQIGGFAEGPSLTIDLSNYTDFGPGGLAATNDEAVTYVINLAEDMGLSDNDFDQILEDMSFSLMVTVTSYTERTRAGTGRYRNTLEYLGDYSAGDSDDGFSGDDGLPVNALDFELIPEPMTLALLSAGSVVLLWRRNARPA